MFILWASIRPRPRQFTATATLSNCSSWEGTITIDQDGTISGQHSDGDYPVKIIKDGEDATQGGNFVTPGFQ